MRPADITIPANEPLYRTVEADWVDGDTVLRFAVDGEGTSCYRSSVIGTPEAARAHRAKICPEESGVVVTLASHLPTNHLARANNVRYDVFVSDLPEEANEAHCEIRWRRSSDAPRIDHFKGIGGAAKQELKELIAAGMRVLIRPAEVPEPTV